jgi:hypothetical protein
MSRIFSLLFVLFFTFSQSLFAEENIYLVEGVTAKYTAKSPSASRTAAIAGARRDAFLTLLSRLKIKTKLADEVTNDEISDMVRSEQINDEKIAGNAYSATLNILFAQDFVEHILSQKIPTTAQDLDSDELYLIVPAEVVKKKVILWEEDNDWKKAVEKTIKRKAKKSFLTPEPDISNISSLNSETLANADYQKLEPALSRYKASAAYVLLFNYDTIENKVIIDVSYIRKMHRKQLRLSFVNVDRLSYEALMDKVADKAIEYLLNAKNNESKNLNSNLVQIKIAISSLENWIAAKNKLENSNFINQLQIQSISQDYVIVAVNYIDGRLPIEESFAKIGFSLSKESENLYVTSAY